MLTLSASTWKCCSASKRTWTIRRRKTNRLALINRPCPKFHRTTNRCHRPISIFQCSHHPARVAQLQHRALICERAAKGHPQCCCVSPVRRWSHRNLARWHRNPPNPSNYSSAGTKGTDSYCSTSMQTEWNRKSNENVIKNQYNGRFELEQGPLVPGGIVR